MYPERRDPHALATNHHSVKYPCDLRQLSHMLARRCDDMLHEDERMGVTLEGGFVRNRRLPGNPYIWCFVLLRPQM